MRSILQLKVSATQGPSSDLKSAKINIVGKRSLDGKENSKHYLRQQGPSLMQPISYAQQSSLKITLTLSQRRSTTYFSQHCQVKRSPPPPRHLSDLRQLLTLTPAQGGLGVPDLRFEAPQQFVASTSITAHRTQILLPHMFMVAGENSTEEIKRQHQLLKTASVKLRMDSTLPSDLLRSDNQLRDQGASSRHTSY